MNKDYMHILSESCWSLICQNTGGMDDSGYMWVVVGSFMRKPHLRVIGESFDEDNPALAVEDALNVTKGNCYSYKYEFNGVL